MLTQGIQVLFETPMELGESPFWHPDEKALYWIDIAARMVHRHEPRSGKHCSWQLPSEPGCIARSASGGIVIAMRSGLALLDTKSGSLSKLADAPYDTSKLRFNDGRCDAVGRLWTGTIYEPRDEARASLFCVEQGRIRDSGRSVTVSNGVAFSTDNRTLYHADTKAHKIMAYDFELATGQIGNGRLFKQFASDKTVDDYGGRPDGAAVDTEDAYWVAMFEGGRILRLSSSGEVLREVLLPVRCPTMVTFGGDDMQTLYVTSARHNRPGQELALYPLSGCVLALRVNVPGRVDPAYTP